MKILSSPFYRFYSTPEKLNEYILETYFKRAVFLNRSNLSGFTSGFLFSERRSLEDAESISYIRLEVPIKTLGNYLFPFSEITDSERNSDNFLFVLGNAVLQKLGYNLELVFALGNNPFAPWEVTASLVKENHTSLFRYGDFERKKEFVEAVLPLLLPGVLKEALLKSADLARKIESKLKNKPEHLISTTEIDKVFSTRMNIEEFLANTLIYSIPYLLKRSTFIMEREERQETKKLVIGLFAFFLFLHRVRGLFRAVEDFEKISTYYEEVLGHWKNFMEDEKNKKLIKDSRLHKISSILFSSVLASARFQSLFLTEELKHALKVLKTVFRFYFESEAFRKIEKETVLFLGTYLLRDDTVKDKPEDVFLKLKKELLRILEEKDKNLYEVARHEIVKILSLLEEVTIKKEYSLITSPVAFTNIITSIFRAQKCAFVTGDHSFTAQEIMKELKASLTPLLDVMEFAQQKKLLPSQYVNEVDTTLKELIRLYNIDRGIEHRFWERAKRAGKLEEISEDFDFLVDVFKSLIAKEELGEYPIFPYHGHQEYIFFNQTFFGTPALEGKLRKIVATQTDKDYYYRLLLEGFVIFPKCDMTDAREPFANYFVRNAVESYNPAYGLRDVIKCISPSFQLYENYLPVKAYFSSWFLKRTLNDMIRFAEEGSELRDKLETLKGKISPLFEKVESACFNLKGNLHGNNSIRIELQKKTVPVPDTERDVPLLDVVAQFLTRKLVLQFAMLYSEDYHSAKKIVRDSEESKLVRLTGGMITFSENVYELEKAVKVLKKTSSIGKKKRSRKTEQKKQCDIGARLLDCKFNVEKLLQNTQKAKKLFYVPGILIEHLHTGAFVEGVSRLRPTIPYFTKIVGGELKNVFQDNIPPEILAVASMNGIEAYTQILASQLLQLEVELDAVKVPEKEASGSEYIFSGEESKLHEKNISEETVSKTIEL